MGTGFTIDTPLRVAKYGISSVISLVDDILIEKMRKFHSVKNNEPYEEVTSKHEDARALRITLYLDLINRIVKRQIDEVRNSGFSKGSEIVRYFELLPDCAARRSYEKMLAEPDPAEKSRMQDELRELVIPGSIDVNIMTKLDKENYSGQSKLAVEFADAMAALRGFAQSKLEASIVFSAGVNKRLYTYLNSFEDFFPDSSGKLKKKVVLKVSDYRSAEVQGNFLAKRGIWVSEYRFESGLNCGGHAFTSGGHLLGPILEQFKAKRQELIEKLFASWNKTLEEFGRNLISERPSVRFTVQGGIGTSAENEMLFEEYKVDGTGWGTPFLLVPEVTNIDDDHLEKLAAATEEDVRLSDCSPLNIPFWNLQNSDSEKGRKARIADGKPGSKCPQALLVSNTEFTDRPICLASRKYQKAKLEAIPDEGYTEEQLERVREDVVAKSCICYELGGTVTRVTGIDPKSTPSICCGPNIVNFSKVVSLEEMVDHIYGRASLPIPADRPHMFTREIMLYIDFLHKEMEKFSLNLSTRKEKYFREFKQNLLEGIEYYRSQFSKNIDVSQNGFLEELKSHFEAVEAMDVDPKAILMVGGIKRKKILAKPERDLTDSKV